jgi:hypothetical protein
MRASKQCGVSLMGLIVGLFVVVVVALFAMKVLPAYMEYATAKSTIEAIARDPGANTPQLVRNAFDARSTIDNITAVKPADLDITKDGNQMVIGFAYRKEVQLFDNVGLYIDFAANTAGQ